MKNKNNTTSTTAKPISNRDREISKFSGATTGITACVILQTVLKPLPGIIQVLICCIIGLVIGTGFRILAHLLSSKNSSVVEGERKDSCREQWASR